MVEANLVVDKVVVAKVVMHEVDEVGVVLVWSHPHPHQALKRISLITVMLRCVQRSSSRSLLHF